MPDPPEDVHDAIIRFNRQYNPTITAKFLTFNDNELHIQFTGPLSSVVGISDYFEDFIIELDSCAPISLTLKDYKQEGNIAYHVRYNVTYRSGTCTCGK